MNSFLAKFGKQSQSFQVVVGFTLIGVIGVADFLTGYELGFSIFYAIPISLVTWFASRRLGLVASFTGAFVWLAADLSSGHPYSHPLIPIWNSLIRLTYFVIIALLLSSLRRATERQAELTRIDYLTGAANSRNYFELAQMEIDRFHRYQHPFTLAYFDLDNFKSVNDQFGHAIGDYALRTVVSTARRQLRKTDVIARLGGDEFALLLPETDQDSARVALSKIHGSLLEEMRLNDWAITFSIGVLTCMTVPPTTKELVRIADDLMYSVKHAGKNAVIYSTYSG